MRKKWEDSIAKFEKNTRYIKKEDNIYVSVKDIRKDRITRTIIATVSIIDVKKKKRTTFKNRRYDMKFLKKMK